MALLSIHQKNAISILKNKLLDAKSNYICALETYFEHFNLEPSKDTDWPNWSKWNARQKLLLDDIQKTFSAYHLAFIRYNSYRRVALGVY